MSMFNNLSLRLQSRSLQVLIVLSLYILAADHIHLDVQRGFYTISLLIKELLVWIIPITVAMYLANTVKVFEKRATLFILLLLIFETISNFSSVWYAYFAASLVAKNVDTFHIISTSSDFTPLWKLPLVKPDWWAPDKGAILGLILGRIAAYRKGSALDEFIDGGNLFVEWILTKVFSRLIPIFILGFAAQMYQMQLLTRIFTNYSILVSWLLLYLAIYISILFLAGAKGSVSKMVTHIKNLLPAGGMALSSGCSLSTMPWTIKGTAKNLQNPFLAKAIIPATTNIQQTGDTIANAFLCFLIYKGFHSHNPDFSTWLQFSLVFVLARFATAAIMGGAIFIMLPIYESYLDFNPEMIAIILALNVVLDPIITATNVLANGALCKVFENLWNSTQKLADNFGRKRIKLPDNVENGVF